MSTYVVTTPEYESLTPEETLGVSDNGIGKEYANYIRIIRNGETVWLESDAMEPEDARFSRDLKWVIDALRHAYECGVVDGRKGQS